MWQWCCMITGSLACQPLPAFRAQQTGRGRHARLDHRVYIVRIITTLILIDPLCYDYYLQVHRTRKLVIMLYLTSYSISYILIDFTFNSWYLYVLIEWSRWGWAGWGEVVFTLVRQLPFETAKHNQSTNKHSNDKQDDCHDHRYRSR